MTTYSFVQYDVLNNSMYFKGTPVPGLEEVIGVTDISSDVNARELLQNVKDESRTPVSSSTKQDIINFLEVIPEIILSDSKTITLTIEIIDNITIGNTNIVSVNLDKTKTYVTKGGLITNIDPLKPIPKPVKPMALCKDCLYAEFTNENYWNFWGSVTVNPVAGQFVNGQKVWTMTVPNFSSAAVYGTTTNYTIFYKTNITYTVTNYGGGTTQITNQNKWVAVPSSTFTGATTNVNASTTYFHVSSGTAATCPYFNDTPLTPPWYNFFGTLGYFFLNVAPNAIPNKQCPQFTFNPGSVNWGYNCISGSCVSAISGSPGQFLTLDSCVNNPCVPPPSPTYYNCNNGCVPTNFPTTNSYASLQDCLDAKCGQIQETTCSCDPDFNTVLNSGFSSGAQNWYAAPNAFTQGVGGWYLGGGYAQASVSTQLSGNSSSLYLSQSNAFPSVISSTPGVYNTCSYSVCFQAWQTGTPNTTAIIGVNGTNNFTPNIPSVPTAFNFTLTTTTPDLIFYLGCATGSSARVNIDNVCVTLIGCEPTPIPAPEACFITGSAYCYDTVEYDCLCPQGYVTGSTPGNCIPSGSITIGNIIVGGIGQTTTPANNWSWGRQSAVLYYDYTSNGLSPTTAATSIPNPLLADPNVYNTQYAFNILKSNFWYGNSLTNLVNSNMVALPNNLNWWGGGSFINITSSGTYYAAIVADDVFRLKLDGTTIVNPSSAQTAYNTMHNNSRTPGLNPNTTVNLGATPGYNWPYLCYHIYPISMSVGCHYISLEGKDINGGSNGFAGFIFNNTATQIAAATNINQLNKIWDTSTSPLIYNFDTTAVTSSCPPGTIPAGAGICDGCLTTGSVVPCGDCIVCNNGVLYKGYVVDRGGNTLKGRGIGGIVNISAVSNSINTWVVPDETDWDTLVTYLNNGVAPSSTTTGSLGVISGGKMKDYTRDAAATCWELPNVGAQDNTNSSGWAGVAGGQLDTAGAYSGLGFEGTWWSANSSPSGQSGILSLTTRTLNYWSNDVYRNIYAKNYGFSLRLVRPAITGENNGLTIFNAYTGNDGKLYDGIVIGTQVWIKDNLNEIKFNDNNSVYLITNISLWNNQNPLFIPYYYSYYDNNTSNGNISQGSIDPVTNQCYTYPTSYIYQKCNSSDILVQKLSGSTITPGKVEQDPYGNCWSFVAEIDYTPNIQATIYSTGSYFQPNNTVYNTCTECTAIHTIYMTFGTKNC